MAEKSTFTHSDYTAQRQALDGLIQDAEEGHRRAGYRLVIGEATQDDVDKALVSLGALKARLRTLDAAWDAAKQQAAEDLVNSRRAARRAAVEQIETQFAARTEAARAMHSAAIELGRAVAAYNEAGDAIVEQVRARYQVGEISMDWMGDTRREIADNGYAGLIVGLLFDNGLNFSGISGANGREEYRKHGGLVAYVEKRNGVVRRYTGRIAEIGA
ncbi:hypothetical protein [Sphingobium indicum]